MNRQAFSQLSALITGYSPIELEGTGLIDAYASLFEQIVGPRFAEQLASS